MLPGVTSSMWVSLRRLIHFSKPNAGLPDAVDPIQKLFVEKIREYAEKQKASGKLIVDSTPETEREVEAQMKYLNTKFGHVTYEEMLKFPEFKFTDPKVDPIDIVFKSRRK